MYPAADLLQGHEDAIAHTFIDGLAQVSLPGGVLYQEYFTGANHARLAIAGRDLYAVIQVDDVLPPRRRMPVEIIGRRYFPENNAGSRQALGKPARRRRLDILNFLSGKVRFALLVRIESVNVHRSPPVA
jgi:hypothetical protein